MDEVVLVIAGPIAVLNWNFQGYAESWCGLIGRADVEPVNVSIGIQEGVGGVRQLGVPMELAKRMEPAVGERSEPLVRLQVG